MTEQDIKYIFKNRDINNRGSYCPMMPNSSCTIQVKTITAKKKRCLKNQQFFACVLWFYVIDQITNAVSDYILRNVYFLS